MFLVGLLILASIAVASELPGVAAAQPSTCHGSLAIAVSPPEVPVGQKATITLTLRTGPIQNGSQLRISRVRYDLDCNANFALGIPCTDQGDVFSYQGNISTTCSGVNWSSNVPAGSSATNDVVFTASPPLMLNANDFTGCTLSFDVQLDNLEPNSGANSDSTPLVTEVVIGYSAALSCYGGTNNLGACSISSDCPGTSGTCFGGAQNGAACASNADCTGPPDGTCVGSCVADAVCDNALASALSESGSIADIPPTPTSTNTPTPIACVGDCNGDGQVSVDEILTGVNIDLGNLPMTTCPAYDCCPICNQGIDFDCILEAVNNALNGCLLWRPDCGPPVFHTDPCPSTVTFCTTDQVLGRGCDALGSRCCQPDSLCTGGFCNEPLVCDIQPATRCPK